MDTSGRRFGREPLRDALRPARHASVPDARIVGPHGVVADLLRVADTPLDRLRGLIARPELGPSEALLVSPCTQVHTVGMRYAIDAVFCDHELRVLRVATLAPRRISPHVHRASCCIELPAGRALECGLEPGVRLEIRPRTVAT